MPLVTSVAESYLDPKREVDLEKEGIVNVRKVSCFPKGQTLSFRKNWILP